MSPTHEPASKGRASVKLGFVGPDLPTEVKFLVLDVLRDRGDRYTLASVARTSTFLRDRATAMLYSIASIGHDQTLTTEEIEQSPSHPLRSHPYLKWADDMEGIEKRRLLLHELNFTTESYPASSFQDANGSTHLRVNYCKCCHTDGTRSADTASASLLRNQLSKNLPPTKLCQVYYRSARAPGQSGTSFSNQIMCMLTEDIQATSVLFLVNPMSDRWRSTFVFATPTRLDIPPEDGSISLPHRMLQRLHSGEVTAGFLPAAPCGDQNEASLPDHRADKGADILPAAQFLFRHVDGGEGEATAGSHRTTFLFADDPCTHKSTTERNDVRRLAADLFDFKGLMGLASNIKIENLDDRPEIVKVLPGGPESSFYSLD